MAGNDSSGAWTSKRGNGASGRHDLIDAGTGLEDPDQFGGALEQHACRRAA